MNIEKEILFLLDEFNQNYDSDDYTEDDLNLVISKYKSIKKLFENFVTGKINILQMNQLFFLIKNSKLILAALNKYFNERMADEIQKEMKKNEALSEVEVLIDRYNDNLISNFQILKSNALAKAKKEGGKTLFIGLYFTDVRFIFAISYEDNNFKVIDSLRIIAVPINLKDKDKNRIFRCELQVNAGIIPIELKYDTPVLIEDAVSIYSFKYKKELYKFIQYRTISEDDIGYVIKYEGKERSREKFSKYLKEQFEQLNQDIALLLDIISRNKYIKIIFEDKDILVPIQYDSSDYINDIIDYACQQFNVK